MTAAKILTELNRVADPIKAQTSARFFKTDPGQYGEGDIFLGLTVPEQRVVAKRYAALPLREVEILLHSKFHEARLIALFILVTQYKKGTPQQRLAIYALYLKNTTHINNWDLVDSSASYIMGPSADLPTLIRLANSANVWERRIAMLACFYTINQGKTEPAFTIIAILKNDSHDLIQKAVGWMLREIGKRCSRKELITWLAHNSYPKLPRTTLRYAIEHFSPQERKAYLQGIV